MDGAASERNMRKKRARLSCLECRKKKLSCDRKLPCHRCIRSGRPAQCSFETIAEQPPVPSPLSQRQEQQIRDLQAEVTELKELLLKPSTVPASDSATEASHVIDVELNSPSLDDEKPQEVEDLTDKDHDVENSTTTLDGTRSDLPTLLSDKIDRNANANDVDEVRSSDPRTRPPQGYYSRHALFRFFDEIPELFPFIRETADDWIHPFGIRITKERYGKEGFDANYFSQNKVDLKRVLPPKEDVDVLVSSYLDGQEQLHRILHVPTFRREYVSFWTTQQAHHTTMTIVILAIISISSACATSNRQTDITAVASKYQAMSTQWVSLSEEWLRQQSLKHRGLVYYQISCLVYLAKRMNIIDKKKWWKETGSLIKDVDIDALHCSSSSIHCTPYMKEMKRRIWAAIKELDLQNSYEFGLPSLLHNIDSDAAPPTNLNDDDFDDASKEIPEPRPLDEYTATSYQVHSARSWSLRLEISRRLFSPGLSKSLCYGDVLRYTHEITQAIEDIPSWDKDVTGTGDTRIPMFTRAFLISQLKSIILTLHRPYLQRDDSRYWLSETVFYHISRDILLLNSKLAELGFQSPAMIREDLFLASLSLVRVAMLQPKSPVSVIVADYQSTIDLLEKCTSLVEDMHLRCCNSELWCFVTLYSAIMLLEIHLGRKSRQTAQETYAQRFLDLYNRQIERQKMSLSDQQNLIPSGPINCADETANSQLVVPDFPTIDWTNDDYPELDFDFFGFDRSMNNVWNV